MKVLEEPHQAAIKRMDDQKRQLEYKRMYTTASLEMGGSASLAARTAALIHDKDIMDEMETVTMRIPPMLKQCNAAFYHGNTDSRAAAYCHALGPYYSPILTNSSCNIDPSGKYYADEMEAEDETFGDEEEEPARNNVQNNPVMGEPTSTSACRLIPCRHWRHSHHGWA